MSQTLFFSFVTLTTTGYGNLVPAENPGQSLAVLEALVGQFFLVIAVGKIVSSWRPRGCDATEQYGRSTTSSRREIDGGDDTVEASDGGLAK